MDGYMLTGKSVLIVEDSAYLALDLSAAVERLNGRVLGPVGTAIDALSLLNSEQIDAVVLGYELPGSDASLVARALIGKGVPFVIHTGIRVPPEVLVLRPKTPVLMKPIEPRDVVTLLSHEVIKAQMAG